jgi:Aldehyde dehydrogenase family
MLLLDSSVCGLFKWRQFEPEVILLAVGWYLRFSLSYRDVEELLADRGLHASRSQLRQQLRQMGQRRTDFPVKCSIGWRTNFSSTDCFDSSGPGMCRLLGRRLFTISQNSGQRTMDTIDALFVDAERNDNLKKAKLENGFYNIVDGEKVSTGRRLSVSNPATGKQLAAVPDVDRELLNKAISAGRIAVSGWSVVPFGRRKAILASLLKKIDDHADELSALLTAEQGGPLAQARWEIDLLTKAFGPALMQMELHENEQDVQHIEHITKRYFPIDVGGAISLWNLSVILSFGKVLPALLAGETVVLRPSPFSPVTVLRISEYIRELLPPGVFNVVIGGHDLWPWMTSHSGIDLIAFNRSANIGKLVLESGAGTCEPVTLEVGGNEAMAVADADPEKDCYLRHRRASAC